MRELGVVVVLNGKVDNKDFQLVVFKRMDDECDYGMLVVGEQGCSFKLEDCYAEFLRQDTQAYLDADTPAKKRAAIKEIKDSIDNILYWNGIKHKKIKLNMETLSSTLDRVCITW